ncbi:Uncharacterised protein [Porphyromonas macacae]|uniref:Uncharacterized protein n=1 Tax=Porphyromonas macacae TaxID=28115 RepID=A0A379EB13_9PORP|nr:hypothetical protein [Porphyromonas macacae]SUB89524.1 Uncharacterised protein [Porphyromonas macacae]
MYKLEFELEQHTPIIHFQAKDAGATLRASEVKPKLDKFILTQIGKRFIKKSDSITEKNFIERGIEYFQNKDAEARRLYEEEKKKGNKDAKLELCLIPGQEGALNYKLSFKLNPDAKVQYFLPMSSNPKEADTLKRLVREKLGVQRVEILPLTSYFGNEDKAKLNPKGDKTEERRKRNKKNFEKNWQKVQLATLVNTPVEGVIYFQNTGLMEEVNNLIADFFMLHNFGARQTKGFGSYTIRSINEKRVYSNSETIIKRMQNYGVKAYLQYQSSKSSILLKNIASFHKKIKTTNGDEISEIRAYFDEEKIEWEKPIARKLLSLEAEKDTEESYTQKYIRALLGLHNLFDFSQLKKQVKVSHETIERFASPIVYKPIGSSIFLILKEIDSKIFNTEFVFSYGEEEEPVMTPSKFDLVDFISFIEDDNLITIKDNEIHSDNHWADM